jgi:hypothetical protein
VAVAVADRNIERFVGPSPTRQRDGASSRTLVERVLISEQAYAEMENRWLRTTDVLLVWIMLVDRLISTTGTHGTMHAWSRLRSTISIFRAAPAQPVRGRRSPP